MFGHSQWRIQDFPEGVRQPRRGAPTYYLTNFFRKLHENEEMLVQRWGRASLEFPLRSATDSGHKLNEHDLTQRKHDG